MSEWISVDDRLPEWVQQVLCYKKEHLVCEVMEYRQGTWYIWNGDFFETLDMSLNDVTHWQPLPPPPTED